MSIRSKLLSTVAAVVLGASGALADGISSSGGGGVQNNPTGGANFTPFQATLSGSASLVVAARAGAPGTGRIAAVLVNEGSASAECGSTSGVTSSTGVVIQVGASASMATTSAVYCVGSGLMTGWETW